MVPPVGSSSPAEQKRRVDLPEPDGPTMAVSRPSRMSRLTSCRTWAVSLPRPGMGNDMCRPRTRMQRSAELDLMGIYPFHRFHNAHALVLSPEIGRAGSTFRVLVPAVWESGFMPPSILLRRVLTEVLAATLTPLMLLL